MISGEPQIIKSNLAIDMTEMMLFQYLPIKLADSTLCSYPKRLRTPLDEIMKNVLLHEESYGVDVFDYNIYATVKSLYVAPGYNGNRPGWHCDGFGTDDINYIWYDRNPTEFCIQEFDLSDECDLSMRQMEQQALSSNIKTYPNKSLIRLDPTNVHRCCDVTATELRTFIKISISKDRYDLKGNSHNHELDYDWPMFDRGETRNHPSYETDS